jgi:hypothetical protein
MTGENQTDHARQFDDITRKQKEISVQHLRDVADRAVADNKRVIEGFLRLSRLISPERVEEVEQLYPGVSLDEPEPFNELLMSMISATNLLLLSAASAKINIEDALKKGHDEILMLEGQVKMERHRANQLQGQVDACQDQLRQAREQVRLRERDKTRSLETKTGSPREPSRFKEPQARKVEDEASGKVQVSPTRSSHPDKNVDGMEMGGALATWREIAKVLREDTLDTYAQLLKIIGSGTVSKEEIQAKFEGKDEKTTEYHLKKLTTDPALLSRRAYMIREEGKPGRKQDAFVLTTLGKAAYRSLTGEIEAIPEDEVLIDAHQTSGHTYLVKTTAIALTRLGFDAVPVLQPIALEDGTSFHPDIKVTGADMGLFFVEAEGLEHIKSKELNTKWTLQARVNKNKIYLVMRKRADAENLGYSIIRKWALDVNYPEEIDVFMTGLDSLEAMDIPPKGARANPWKIKTIRPSSQKELLP